MQNDSCSYERVQLAVRATLPHNTSTATWHRAAVTAGNKFGNVAQSSLAAPRSRAK
ncbi:hypothetical protein J6590_097010 [Homalodisca vitripennis]|nr:hypothetical protein J6590_097010 [Homalodisca vitripennis]